MQLGSLYLWRGAIEYFAQFSNYIVILAQLLDGDEHNEFRYIRDKVRQYQIENKVKTRHSNWEIPCDVAWGYDW